MGNRVLNIEENNNSQLITSHKMRSNTSTNSFFWRKHCVFIILFFLMILIAINLGFTLWILKALEVSQVSLISLDIINLNFKKSSQSTFFSMISYDRYGASSCRNEKF
jgi:hypothetical protein